MVTPSFEQVIPEPSCNRRFLHTLINSEIVKVANAEMVLARARVFDPASGVVAARERRSALIGKGAYRDCATLDIDGGSKPCMCDGGG